MAAAAVHANRGQPSLESSDENGGRYTDATLLPPARAGRACQAVYLPSFPSLAAPNSQLFRGAEPGEQRGSSAKRAAENLTQFIPSLGRKADFSRRFRGEREGFPHAPQIRGGQDIGVQLTREGCAVRLLGLLGDPAPSIPTPQKQDLGLPPFFPLSAKGKTSIPHGNGGEEL